MPSLLDIAPLVETVTIRGVDLEVRGLGIDSIAYFIGRYPALGAIIASRSAEMRAEEPAGGAALVEQLGPDAIGVIIACATGRRGDAEHEAAAAGLALEEQVIIIESVMRMTAPSGLVPFVARIAKMAGVDLAVAVPGRAPDTTSPSPLSN